MISPEALRRYHYFANISEQSLKSLAMIAEEKSVPAGTEMFREGDPADTLHVITQGEVEIRYQLGNGEQRAVDTLVGGELLCWSALIEPYKATAIGTTVKDTQLICLHAKKVRELCDADPLLGYQLAQAISKLLAQRLESARVQLAAAD
ncbi:MAG: cyclic nucleotide-binding domain-containing protein [Thermoguttaceae bacterium]